MSKKVKIPFLKDPVEEELPSARELYRAFINSHTDMVFLKDERFRYAVANRALCDFFGKEEAEIIGRTDFELMDGKMAEQCRGSDMEVIKLGKVIKTEETVGGRVFETRKFPVRLVGNKIGIVGYVRDISERMETERLLKESVEKYRTLVDAANQGIVITQDGLVKFANARLAEMSGYSISELSGKPFIEFVHPDDRDLVLTQFHNRPGDREAPLVYEFRFITKDGQIMWAENNGAFLHWQGCPAILNFLNDISERKRIEGQIRASLQEKEVLLKEIHHRVKNNLQIISSLLKLQSTYIDDPKLQEIIEESHNRIWAMSLIHEKLYQSENLARIDMNEYIRSLINGLLGVYGVPSGTIELKIKIANIFLSIDKVIPLALILNELVTNVLKHAFQGGHHGRLRIELSETRGVPTGTNTYALTVADNGIGLPGNFDPSQAKTLGLLLVSKLTGQINGSIAVNCKGGTEFRITFNGD